MAFFKMWKSKNTRVVTLASEHLGVSEHELFVIAYRGWHKCEPQANEIQHTLNVYTAKGAVPRWLSHYLSQLDARTHFKSNGRTPLLQTHRLAEIVTLMTLMLLLHAFSSNARLHVNEEQILSC